MSTDEQAERTSGSVPHAYGNAIAWRWSREMPTALKRSSMLTLLYALRSIAAASGELKFQDGKAIRIQDIVKAAGCDERDGRDRLQAAIVAGVLAVKGEQRRGVATLYALVVHPRPDWDAASQFLEDMKRAREEAKAKRAAKKAAPWAEDEEGEFRGRPPELGDQKFGGPPPELTDGSADEVRGSDPRLSSGVRPPIGSGVGPPNNPGSTHGFPMGGADVVSQPQVDGGWEQEPPAEDEPPEPGEDDGPCLVAIEGGGLGLRSGQSPLLLTVQDGPAEDEAAPLPDLTRIADRMSALYGVVLPRRYAAPVALEILGDRRLPDPTAHVLAALDADPDRYRPPLPDRRTANGS